MAEAKQENCDIFNVVANVMSVVGYNNTVRRCLIHHTGAGGIVVEGGERKNLNLIENNHIHHFSEISSPLLLFFSISEVIYARF